MTYDIATITAKFDEGFLAFVECPCLEGTERTEMIASVQPAPGGISVICARCKRAHSQTAMRLLSPAEYAALGWVIERETTRVQ